MRWLTNVTALIGTVAALISAIVALIQLWIEIRKLRTLSKGTKPKIIIRIKVIIHAIIRAYQTFTGLFLPLLVGCILVVKVAMPHVALIEYIGRPIGGAESFSVDGNYYPSGKMGDIGDIEIKRDVGADQFTYEARGRPSHEWDWKYINGELNNAPAKFGGVMYLDPPNNFGQVYGGFDLRPVREILRWEARGVGENVVVEFVIGGIDWVWDEKEKKKVKPPYPDSMPGTRVTKKLISDWQSFEYSLSRLEKKNFKRVVGGFGWVINWGSNGVKTNESGTGAENPKTFTIEIRNIRYERR